MPRIQMEGWKCERCEHMWVPRSTTDNEPTICPKCKSPYWNKPRIVSTTKQQAILKHFKNKRSKKNEHI